MGRTDTYGKLTIKEENGILTAKFRKNMKYGKLENENLLIKEVEQGKEVGGSLTEQQIIEQGYKPVCEIEKPQDDAVVRYVEYENCIVQEWIIENVEEYEVYSTTD